MKDKQLVAGAGRIAEAKARFRGALRNLAIAQSLAEKAEADSYSSHGAAAEEHAPAEIGLEANTGKNAGADQNGGSADGEAGAHGATLEEPASVKGAIAVGSDTGDFSASAARVLWRG